MPIYGQNSVYKLKGDNLSYDSFLYLCDSTYVFQIEREHTQDIIVVTTLSIGSYSLTDSQLTITDNLTNCELSFNKKDNNFIANDGFVFFKDKIFELVLYAECEEYIKNSYVSKKDYAELCELEHLYEKTEKKHNIILGTYEFESSAESLHLNILKNNLFQYEYNDVLIMEGFWERKGNVLFLKSKGTDCVFFVLVNEGFIIGNLPGAINKSAKRVNETKSYSKGFGCSRKR